MLQKDIHAICIAIWENEKATVTRYRLNRTIGIAILTNMMAGYTRTDPFSTPAMLWLIDSPKTCFVLKHKPNSFGIVENFGQFMDSEVNFFEESIASGPALFGCLLLGSFLLQP